VIDGQGAREMTFTLVARAPVPVLATPRPENARAEALPLSGAVQGVVAAPVGLPSVDSAATPRTARHDATDRAQLHEFRGTLAR